MSTFNVYARYYGLLYRDKDYAAEANYVHDVIQRHNPGARTILELGCGTGAHAVYLADLGYDVIGVDQSHEMLAAANERLKTVATDTARRLCFSHGDIREVRLETRFDAAVSLFHVISYLPTHNDLKSAFSTARCHLNPGGLFVFDCWYGPAVLTEQPAVRIKRMEDDETRVVRIAEPVMYPNENRVDVNYQVFVMNRTGGQFEVLQETHRMRYLFLPEIELLLADSGLRLIDCSEWMTGRPPSSQTWGVCCTCRV